MIASIAGGAAGMAASGAMELGKGVVTLVANDGPIRATIESVRAAIIERFATIADIAFGNIAASAITKLAEGPANFAKELISGNATMERYQVSLEGIMGSAEKARLLLDDLLDLAARTPYTFPFLTKMTQQLVSAGATATQAKEMLKKIGDGAAASPQGMEVAVARIIKNINDIKAKGRLTGGDMNEFANAGVPARQILAEAFQMPFEEVQKKLKEGVISTTQVVNALLDGMAAKFPDGMLKLSKTFDGMLSTLQDFWLLATRTIGKPIFDLAKQGVGKLVDVLDPKVAMPYFEGISSWVQKLIDKGAEWYESMGGWSGIWAMLEKGAEVIARLVGGFSLVNVAIPAAISPLKMMSNLLYKMVTAPVGTLFDMFSVGASLIASASMSLDNYTGILTSLQEAGTQLGNVLNQMWTEVEEFIARNNPAFERWGNLIEVVAQSIIGKMNVGLLESSQLASMLQAAFERIEPIVTKTLTTIYSFVTNFKEVSSAIIDVIKAAFDYGMESIREKWSLMLANLTTALIDWAAAVPVVIGKVAASVKDAIIEGTKQAAMSPLEWLANATVGRATGGRVRFRAGGGEPVVNRELEAEKKRIQEQFPKLNPSKKTELDNALNKLGGVLKKSEDEAKNKASDKQVDRTIVRAALEDSADAEAFFKGMDRWAKEEDDFIAALQQVADDQKRAKEQESEDNKRKEDAERQKQEMENERKLKAKRDRGVQFYDATGWWKEIQQDVFKDSVPKETLEVNREQLRVSREELRAIVEHLQLQKRIADRKQERAVWGA